MGVAATVLMLSLGARLKITLRKFASFRFCGPSGRRPTRYACASTATVKQPILSSRATIVHLIIVSGKRKTEIANLRSTWIDQKSWDDHEPK